MKHVKLFENFINENYNIDSEFEANHEDVLISDLEHLKSVIKYDTKYVNNLIGNKTGEEAIRAFKAIKPILVNRFMRTVKDVDMELWKDIKGIKNEGIIDSIRNAGRKVISGIKNAYNYFDEGCEDLAHDLDKLEDYITKKIREYKNISDERKLKTRIASDGNYISDCISKMFVAVIDAKIDMLKHNRDN